MCPLLLDTGFFVLLKWNRISGRLYPNHLSNSKATSSFIGLIIFDFAAAYLHVTPSGWNMACPVHYQHSRFFITAKPKDQSSLNV